MEIKRYMQKDSNGRRYPIFMCDSGHWHRGRQQAVKCNRKNRNR